MEQPQVLKGEECPFCHEKALTLTESYREIPGFGKAFLFSMTCDSCKAHKADVEAEKQEPAKYTFEVASEKDLDVKVVKNSEATVKLPHMIDLTPGPASQGFVTNIGGILRRVKKQFEDMKENAEEDADKKKAKKALKKLMKVEWGQEKQKIILEDTTGNSAIVSDKAAKTKIKRKS